MSDFYRRMFVALIFEVLFAYCINNILYHWETRNFIKRCTPTECSENITVPEYNGCHIMYNVTAFNSELIISISDPIIGCHENATVELSNTHHCMVDPINLVGFIGDKRTSQLDLLDLSYMIIFNLLTAIFNAQVIYYAVLG